LNTESEFAGEADRAAQAAADQIAAMIDAARGAAVVIERRAREADEERRSADEQAARVLDTLRRIESELMLLVSHVAREADALSATMERARLRSASVVLGPGASTPVVPLVRGPAAAEAISPVETEAPTDVVQETEPEPAPEPAEPEPEPVPEPEPEPEPEPAEPVTATFEAPSGVAKTFEAGSLEDEARSRVTGKTDLELAELHQIAVSRASVGSEEDRRYWAALTAAAVHEAVSRSGFGKLAAGEDVASWRARKKRAKRLRPLMEARDQALRNRPT
jgi:hypothetical protein